MRNRDHGQSAAKKGVGTKHLPDEMNARKHNRPQMLHPYFFNILQ